MHCHLSLIVICFNHEGHNTLVQISVKLYNPGVSCRDVITSNTTSPHDPLPPPDSFQPDSSGCNLVIALKSCYSKDKKTARIVLNCNEI